MGNEATATWQTGVHEAERIDYARAVLEFGMPPWELQLDTPYPPDVMAQVDGVNINGTVFERQEDISASERCEMYRKQLGGMTAAHNRMKEELKQCRAVVRKRDRQLSKMTRFAEDCWKEIKALGRDEVFLYDFLDGMAHELGLEQ